MGCFTKQDFDSVLFVGRSIVICIYIYTKTNIPPTSSRSDVANSQPTSPLVQWDAFILTVSQRKIHILQTLRRRTLKQVINRRINNNPLARAMHRKATNLDAVLARDVLHERRLAQLEQLLDGVVADRHGAGGYSQGVWRGVGVESVGSVCGRGSMYECLARTGL